MLHYRQPVWPLVLSVIHHAITCLSGEPKKIFHLSLTPRLAILHREIYIVDSTTLRHHCGSLPSPKTSVKTYQQPPLHSSYLKQEHNQTNNMTAPSSNKKAVHFGAGNIGKCSHGPQKADSPLIEAAKRALLPGMPSSRLAVWPTGLEIQRTPY